ncbi:MAG TPA: EAL domain-containing protein, partial [Rhodospirillaceae bacterium]|nr:EAL domain-containing protein [Rhodospirillaceae bacterium]
ERAGQRSQLLLQNASDGVHILSETGALLEASDSFFRMLGYDRAELIGQTPLAWDCALSSGQLSDVIARQFAEAQTTKFETSHRRKDGSIFDVEITGRALDLNGRRVLFNSARDISERKKAEEKIRSSELKYRTLFEQTGDAILLNDQESFFDCNQAALKLFGCETKEQFFPNHPGGTLSPPTQPCGTDSRILANQWIAKAMEFGNVRFEWQHRRISTGEVFPAEVMLSALQFEGRTVIQGIVRDITERKQAELRIRELAYFDPLTGLPNRRLLMDRLNQAVAAAIRHRQGVALLLVDLDNFKMVNDSQGHEQGDILLQEVAQRLSKGLAEADTVGRMGGDEFLVVLTEMADGQEEMAEKAEIAGRKILGLLGAPYRIANADFYCTPSIGVTLFGGNPLSIDALLRQADIALYQAKSSGKNRVQFFDPALHAVIQARSQLEAELHRAIEQKQLVLFYQPQVDDQGRPTGAEALVRWQHPQKGLLPPAAFIPLAEESGLIHALGQWVLETACHQLAVWSEQPGLMQMELSVNVSAKQFRETDYVDQLLNSLRISGVDPGKLKLELTESLLLDNIEDVIAKMALLKEKGIGLSLDDFGTGYSSLSYLKRLPLDQLKIDQSFVQDMLLDVNNATIAKTIVTLGQSLGFSVIAEGVETGAQRDFLARSGCLAYQGYFFSRPLPLEKFEAFALEGASL